MKMPVWHHRRRPSRLNGGWGRLNSSRGLTMLVRGFLVAKDWTGEMNTLSGLVPCIGCGGYFADIDGPTHRYLESSPGCAAACGELFACHYENMDYYGDVYRLANDAYAVQHPGGQSRQAIQSVGIHLIRLCLVLEHSLPAERANDAALAAARRKRDFFWLQRPPSMGDITVANFKPSLSGEEHKKLLMDWARSTWAAWKPHHATVRSWLPRGWAPPRR